MNAGKLTTVAEFALTHPCDMAFGSGAASQLTVEFPFFSRIPILLKALRQAVSRNIRPSHAAFVYSRNSKQLEFEHSSAVPSSPGEPRARMRHPICWSSQAKPSESPSSVAMQRVEVFRPFCDEAAKEQKTVAGTLRRL
jgi:hypothetical protein